MDVPDVHYARAGGVAIAYQVVGEGDRDLVFAPTLCDLFTVWLNPSYFRSFLDRLAVELRLIVFNPRGTGLSDRPRNVTLEARMEDITAVMDATGSERATLFGVSSGASACSLFAATYPDRCGRLVVADMLPRSIRSASYPFGLDEEGWHDWVRDVREHWGEREFFESFARDREPDINEEEFEWFVWQQRLAVSPGAAADFARMSMEIDVTGVLESIRVSTLIIHRPGARDVAEYLTGRIRDTETLEAASSLYAPAIADAVVGFTRDMRGAPVPSSVLATVLFTDLVGSTERATELGDRAWRELLAEHHRLVRQELARYRGVEIDTAGDGFFCRFDGPARAIACAQAICESARTLELEIKAGIHIGECEVLGEKITGLAVNVGSRISSLAAPGEVLVSQTVKDLVAGSGINFEERGEHELKGVPGTWSLYAVAHA